MTPRHEKEIRLLEKLRSDMIEDGVAGEVINALDIAIFELYREPSEDEYKLITRVRRECSKKKIGKGAIKKRECVNCDAVKHMAKMGEKIREALKEVEE